jgi:hypothetical protein
MFPKIGYRLITAAVLVFFVAGPQTVILAAEAPGDNASDGAAAERAVVTAREALSRQLADPTLASQLSVVSTKAHTWKSSGLGCGPPRAMTSPVITEGFIVVFALPSGAEKRVHVAGSQAVVCNPTGFRQGQSIALPAANVGALAEKARADLAERLGVPVAEIVVEKFTPVRWTNTALECPLPNEASKASLVRGYRLRLRHNDLTFTYHTDYENVRACPPVNSQ